MCRESEHCTDKTKITGEDLFNALSQQEARPCPEKSKIE
jgi:hypothetical protein